MKADEILNTARDLVTGDRAADYGDMKDNMQTVAQFWNVYLKQRLITAEDAAMMLALLKVARISTGGAKSDNFIDLAGYAAIAGQASE